MSPHYKKAGGWVMAKFQVGDTVTCLRNSAGYTGVLTVGKDYKVLKIGTGGLCIWVMGDTKEKVGPYASRFTLTSAVLASAEYEEALEAQEAYQALLRPFRFQIGYTRNGEPG